MDHAEIESFAQEHLEHEKKFASALKSTINVVKKLTLQRDRAVAALAEMDGKRHALEEQLRRSATVCPQDGCMLWRGHQSDHANVHTVSDALAVHDSWSTTAREIADLLGAQVDDDSGNAESLQDAARRVIRERNEARANHTHAGDELGRWKRDYARLSDRHAETIKERDELRRERDDDYRTFDRMTDLLTQIASALKGEPPELTLHGWHDLPELAAKAMRGRDDLYEALVQTEIMLRHAATWAQLDATPYKQEDLRRVANKAAAAIAKCEEETKTREEEQQRHQEAPAPEADGGPVRSDDVRAAVHDQRADVHAGQGAQGPAPDDAGGLLARGEAAVRALSSVQRQYLLGQLEERQRAQFTAGPQAWQVWDAILRVARALAQ